MHRNDRAAIAQETLRIIERGGYETAANQTVTLHQQITAARAGTKLYTTEVLTASRPPTRKPTVITVTEETTFAAIARLGGCATDHVCALNFASARNPGGGFLGGAQAQEEALARASALYPCLLTQSAYYDQNRAHRSAIYLDLAIYSPHVPFFRDDDGRLLDAPVFASVITAPAPNAGAIAQNEPANLARIESVLRRRATMVLAIAEVENVDRLILGAWGCGVFRNDPAMVAQTFADLLAPGAEFGASFSEVVFAIYDRTPQQGTLKAFERELRRT